MAIYIYIYILFFPQSFILKITLSSFFCPSPRCKTIFCLPPLWWKRVGSSFSSTGVSFPTNVPFSFVHVLACFRGHCCRLSCVFFPPNNSSKRGTEGGCFWQSNNEDKSNLSFICDSSANLSLLCLASLRT